MSETESGQRRPGRLVAWLGFVLALALLSYSARLSGEDIPDDLAYRYSSSVAALIQYGLMLGILLLIARGLPRRELFALRRPVSWPRALGKVTSRPVYMWVLLNVMSRSSSLR